MTSRVKKKMVSAGALNYRIVDTDSDLTDVSRAFCREKTVAVDLESDSMHNYKEKVCLIQIATEQASAVIDPLRIENISALKPVFSNPKIQKVFHGADYDIRSLYRDFHISANNLFDTELASRFLGVRESGLEAVLRHRFGVSLDKKFQKKNWSKRPLPIEMVEYAATDVRYLVPLARQLQKELDRNGRWSWVAEECQILSKVRSTPFDGKPLYLRFKGAGKLSPRSLAVLEALLTLRDEIAEKKDKPWFKIFRNESLMKIADLKTTDLAYMEKNKILSRKQITMYGNALVEAIESASGIPEDRLPRYPHKRSPVLKTAVRKRIKALKAWRDAKALKLRLDPAIVCSKALIAAIAQNNPETESALCHIKEMRTWQRGAFGKEIVEVLNP